MRNIHCWLYDVAETEIMWLTVISSFPSCVIIPNGHFCLGGFGFHLFALQLALARYHLDSNGAGYFHPDLSHSEHSLPLWHCHHPLDDLSESLVVFSYLDHYLN